ncbi:glycoside hydrolase family 28 protein [Sphingomonas sp. JC676]|uniref:rhamnogalacturonidase n=1 Tax=Sphingomonas sp. JC676 TaxID=2768065 RepID=UPI0021F0A313|nr:glycosyl hydrolase family 28-related protein [Sphingomonas sp. JC676]
MNGAPTRLLAEAELSRRGAVIGLGAALLAQPALAQTARMLGAFYDVRGYGAKGDGKAIDSNAINRAIEAATKAGGGTVVVPPGRYLCFSIRLRNNVTIVLSAGAVIEAADPAVHKGAYDEPENDMEEQFQDFGITHVHNSLIYGDGVSNIAIVGRGMIHGLGLNRDGPGDRWHNKPDWKSPKELGITPREARLRDPKERAVIGRANKSIGLRNCRNVVLRDFIVLQGGHFCVIAHGVTNMTIDNLTIDTDRDGIDIDCCRDVRVSNCVVNAPKDDAIVLKSSYALDRKVICEDVTVIGCKTMGYVMGSLLDGTYRKSDYNSVDSVGPLGRIKLGTESNGGFRNIQITNCTCENSRGILMGVVDGGTLEDVIVSDITMRNPVNHPLFIHQAARLRAPAGTTVGKCRRVKFSDINVSGADPRYPCGVAGIVDGPIEDVSFTNIDVTHRGGGTAEDAARVPEDRRVSSLEVSFMGTLPAHGFFARHARRLILREMTFRTDAPDARPTIVLDDVRGAIIEGIVSQRPRATAIDARGSSDITAGDIRSFE